MAKATNIDKFIGDLAIGIKQFSEAIIPALQVVALDARASLKYRFIQQGAIATDTGEEISFPNYSEKYLKKKEKEGKGGNENNRLVYTGNMLQSLQIIGSAKDKGKYSVILGASDSESQDKVNYNSSHYGDIFNLTSQEKKELQKTFNDELIKSLKTNKSFK